MENFSKDPHENNNEYKQSLLETEMQQYKKQENLLDQLNDTFGSLKHVAINMGNELDEQKEIIEELTCEVDHATVKLENVTKKMERLRRMKECGGTLCKIILILILIAILIIIVYGKQFGLF